LARLGGVRIGGARLGEVRQGYLIKIMSGITTSETLRGEQPKDDNLGSREQQLIRKVKALKVETSVLQIDMDNRLSEFRRSVLNIMLELDEWAENKINDEDQR
jgi:hypothetical protein